MGGEINTEICDYCGSLTQDIRKCYICTYDLCEADSLVIDVQYEQENGLVYCKSCIERYYSNNQVEKFEQSIFK